MRSITEIVQRFKQDWVAQLGEESIAAACRDCGMTWIESVLNPVVTVQLFLLQILHGNTACQHLPHLSGITFTAAGYCIARTRLKLEALETLLSRCVSAAKQTTFDTGRWFGHRVFLVDGSSFSMPDTPALQGKFGQPGGQQKGCGFPTAHWLALMHAGTGMITKMLASPLRTHDMSRTVELHPDLLAGDVLVADRAFCSYAHLALLVGKSVHGLLRIHQRTIVDFTPGRPHAVPGKGKSQNRKGMPRSKWLRQLGECDQIVQWLKPTSPPDWMTLEQFDALPGELTLRELRFNVTRNGFRVREITLVTTLLDELTYSISDLADLYRTRWDIETNFGHIKTTMKMDVLKCKTVEGVLKELTVFALVYNLVRHVMIKSAAVQDVAIDRISFIDALRWLQSDAQHSLAFIFVNPDRPNRYEPRVRKRRPKNYSLMKKPRCKLKKEMTTQ